MVTAKKAEKAVKQAAKKKDLKKVPAASTPSPKKVAKAVKGKAR